MWTVLHRGLEDVPQVPVRMPFLRLPGLCGTGSPLHADSDDFDGQAGQGRYRESGVTMSRFILATCVVLAFLPLSSAQAVPVKHMGDVDLSAFTCQDTPESSNVRSICYSKGHPNVVVNLDGVRYGYCGVPGSVVQAWLSAPSKGKFYHANVKGRFDCRYN